MSIPNIGEIIKDIFGQLISPTAIPILLAMSIEDFERQLVVVRDQLTHALEYAGISTDLKLRLQELDALNNRLAAADRTNAAFVDQIAALRANVQDLTDQVIGAQRETTRRAPSAARGGRTEPQHNRNEEVDDEDGDA
jgi:hypothetical protein